MKKGFGLVFLFLTCLSFGQEQNELSNYADASTKFQSYYNAGDYAGVFDMFDADMKKAMPRENTINFFSQNVNALMGTIEKMEFLEMKQGAHVYRTSFEKAVADIVISLNAQNQINGLFISPVRVIDNPIIERNSVDMILPFKEEWFVFWGGTTVEQNYHVAHDDQKYAYDILMVKDGASYIGDSKKNESYFVFGKDIIAPCDARVVKVIKGVKDNIPGELNPQQLTGNTVVLQVAQNEYLLFAHLKEGSITVEEGNDIAQGDVIGQCGNSGNTTEPHLHLSLQNDIEMTNAMGAKLYFSKLLVNGEIKEDYLPVKEDLIKNIN